MDPTDVTLAPRLVVADANRAIEFYVRHFDATELERYNQGGRVVHAGLEIAGYGLSVKDADDVDSDATALGGTPVLLHLDFPNTDAVDSTVRSMLADGARLIFPVQGRGDEGYGGRLVDPFGIVWILGCRTAG